MYLTYELLTESTHTNIFYFIQFVVVLFIEKFHQTCGVHKKSVNIDYQGHANISTWNNIYTTTAIKHKIYKKNTC